jgi:hypothetical protein
MKIEQIKSTFEALLAKSEPMFGPFRIKPPRKIKVLNPPHQLSNRCPQRFGNGLNRKKTRVFHASFYPAQKGPINVGFGSKRFLRQFPPHPELPNLLTKSFGNIMTHLRQVCPFAMAGGCRLYTTTPLDNESARCHDQPHWIFKPGVARRADELCHQSPEDRASVPQRRLYRLLMAGKKFDTKWKVFERNTKTLRIVIGCS